MFIPEIEGSDHDPGVARSPTIHGSWNHSEFIRGAVPTGDCESFRDSNLQVLVVWVNWIDVRISKRGGTLNPHENWWGVYTFTWLAYIFAWSTILNVDTEIFFFFGYPFSTKWHTWKNNNDRHMRLTVLVLALGHRRVRPWNLWIPGKGIWKEAPKTNFGFIHVDYTRLPAISRTQNFQPLSLRVPLLEHNT